MIRKILIVAALLALSACSSNYRFMGFNNCSADRSPVWFEFPNAQGNYDGLNNSPCS
jgi:hypothetical protein